MRNNLIWRTIYKFYPTVLRLLEKIGIHKIRQPFLLGHLNPKWSAEELKARLLEEGFEDAILTWKDTGEILNMRKVDQNVFQYHLRLFTDGEIRGHHEYSSEGAPLAHIFEKGFKEAKEYFGALLGEILRVEIRATKY